MADQKRADPEQARLEESRTGRADWKKWGPYLSERQWGTVREDYSEDGNAWDYFTHDQARSRAYRWGEDGLAGISDSKQRLCFALALWNGRDPILKERLFGLTNAEGNHGEDVKEYYFYLDSTPTHSYMKYLYKYPQRRFPYEDLVRTNAARGKDELEYELLDTGAFDQDRYFDVFVEYAKAGPEDLLIRIDVANRGPEAADLHVLPTLWFRNTWSWGGGSQAVAGAGGASRGERRRHPPHRLRSPRTRCPTTTCTARASRRCSSPRTRPTPAPLGTAQPVALREGRDPRLRGARPEPGGEPGRARDQGRGARPAHCRPGRDPQRPAAPDPRPARADARSRSRISTRSSSSAGVRPTSSTTASPRRR